MDNAGRKETRTGAPQPLADGDGLAREPGRGSQGEQTRDSLFVNDLCCQVPEARNEQRAVESQMNKALLLEHVPDSEQMH